MYVVSLSIQSGLHLMGVLWYIRVCLYHSHVEGVYGQSNQDCFGDIWNPSLQNREAPIRRHSLLGVLSKPQGVGSMFYGYLFCTEC